MKYLEGLMKYKKKGLQRYRSLPYCTPNLVPT